MSRSQTLSSRNDDSDSSAHAGARRAVDHVPDLSLQSAGIVFSLVMLLLVADSILRAPGAFEYWVINMVQGVAAPLASTIFQMVDSLSSLTFLLATWAIVLMVAAIWRKWGAVVATLMTPIAALTAVATGHFLATRPAPDPSLLERTVQQTGLFALPSAQVVGAVLIYGLVFFLARGVQTGAARLAIQGVSASMVLLVGVSQLWLGSMWPTEVLTAYTIGGLLIVPLLWVARRVDMACGRIPLVSAARVPCDESKPHTRALTSTIIFNETTVSKIYRPGFLPRAIYWLAFQAEFPYMRNQAALQAAVHRRNLVGMLTEYWYGSSHVARAVGIDEISGRYAITSEYVSGSEPTDRDAARQFLQGLVERFEAAGLPTWQIDPRQPRATDNVIETEDGSFQVVDLESGLVSPLASLRTWRRAFRRGQVPIYDDVYFDVTRSYIERHEAMMRAEKGDAWVRRLYSTLNATEAQTQAWHDSEPRIWSRLLGRRRHQQDDATVRQNWAIQWFEDGIRRWREEGRISGAEAGNLQRKVRSPQFISVMPHFGVHLSTGVLLRFPLGSIARASYTGFNLLRITWRYVRRQIGRTEWQEGASIHSPLVILFAAVPGIGAFSYLASGPIRSDHLLLRVGLDSVMLKFPWRLYERSGLRWLITDAPDLVYDALGPAEEDRHPVPLFSWTEEHRTASSLDPHPWTRAVAEGYSVRSIV